jgi:hypothetical protein
VELAEQRVCLEPELHHQTWQVPGRLLQRQRDAALARPNILPIMRRHGLPPPDENEATWDSRWELAAPEEIDTTVAGISYADPAGILAPHRGPRTGSSLRSFWTSRAGREETLQLRLWALSAYGPARARGGRTPKSVAVDSDGWGSGGRRREDRIGDMCGGLFFLIFLAVGSYATSTE